MATDPDRATFVLDDFDIGDGCPSYNLQVLDGSLLLLFATNRIDKLAALRAKELLCVLNGSVQQFFDRDAPVVINVDPQHDDAIDVVERVLIEADVG
jgi:hypothetical protein